MTATQPSAVSGLPGLMLRLMNLIIVSAGIVMSLTFFLVVIFRYGFETDLFAYEEWLMTLAFWMFFMASAAATHDKQHVNADIIGVLFSDPLWIWRRAVLVEMLECLIALVVTYWGFLMCQEEFMTYPNWQSTIALNIPFVVPRIGIFTGFLLMSLYNALHLTVLLKSRPEPAEQQTPSLISQDI